MSGGTPWAQTPEDIKAKAEDGKESMPAPDESAFPSVHQAKASGKKKPGKMKGRTVALDSLVQPSPGQEQPPGSGGGALPAQPSGAYKPPTARPQPSKNTIFDSDDVALPTAPREKDPEETELSRGIGGAFGRGRGSSGFGDGFGSGAGFDDAPEQDISRADEASDWTRGKGGPGGGFLSAGNGGVAEPRRQVFNFEEEPAPSAEAGPSKADAADTWVKKKPPPPPGQPATSEPTAPAAGDAEARRPGFGGFEDEPAPLADAGPSKADVAESWVKKKPPPPPGQPATSEPTPGYGAAAPAPVQQHDEPSKADSAETWVKKKPPPPPGQPATIEPSTGATAPPPAEEPSKAESADMWVKKKPPPPPGQPATQAPRQPQAGGAFACEPKRTGFGFSNSDATAPKQQAEDSWKKKSPPPPSHGDRGADTARGS